MLKNEGCVVIVLGGLQSFGIDDLSHALAALLVSLLEFRGFLGRCNSRMLFEFFPRVLIGEVQSMYFAGTLGAYGSFLCVKPNAQQAYAQQKAQWRAIHSRSLS